MSPATDPTTEDRAARARFDRQAGSYRFPYHWVPEANGALVRSTRTMSWAFEYLAILDATAALAAAQAPRRILDVGCGDGRVARALLDAAPEAEVVGVDPVAQAIAFAEAFHFGDARVRFEATTVEELEDDGFDVATMAEVLEHIPDGSIAPLIEGIWQRLAADGVLVISVPTAVLPVHAKHERHYDEALLRRHLAPWFEISSSRWLHVPNRAAWALERVTANRAFALLDPHVATATRRAYDRWVRDAPAGDGAHLVCVARRVPQPSA